MKVALVTGAAKGLGFAWCQHLSALGYTVILTARSFDKAEAAANEIGVADLIIPKALDVANEQELQLLAKWAHDHYGKIDLIINNAGINPKDFKDPQQRAKAFEINALEANELLSVIEINSIAPMLVIKHFRSLLKASDQAKVINISSWLGSVTNLAFGGHYGYVGSKNLLNVFTKSVALEIKGDNITVVTVNPGWVKTDMGGAKAQFTPQEAVFNLMTNVVDKLSIAHTGKFLNYDGTEHPW